MSSINRVIIQDDCLQVDFSKYKVECIITDPPYYVLPKGKQLRNGGKDSFTWDSFSSKDSFLQWTSDWFEKYYNILENDSFMFVFWSQKYFTEGVNLFKPQRILLWNYRNLVLGGNGDFAYDYEPIFVIKKGNPKLISGKHSSILSYTKPQSNFNVDKLIHPTQKPLELYKHLIKITNKDSYLDMFAGSGTLGAACESLNKDYILIEKDSKNFKLINDRLSTVLGSRNIPNNIIQEERTDVRTE